MIHFISNETSNLENHTTWHNDTHELNMDVLTWGFFLFTAVTFYDSFGNCHTCQGYLNCKSNDDGNDKYE